MTQLKFLHLITLIGPITQMTAILLHKKQSTETSAKRCCFMHLKVIMYASLLMDKLVLERVTR